MRKLKILTGLTLAGLGGYQIDKNLCYSVGERAFRTFFVAAQVSIDYKLNFKPEKADQIVDLHTRTANRIFKLCRDNGGLFIKFGQQIATIPVLPPEFLRLFKTLFDQAPSHEYATVKKIIEREFGKPIDEIFSEFEETARASASIAQVHKARLKNGDHVAVKVQKPEILFQVNSDLFCYTTVMYFVEKYFQYPGLYSAATYVANNIRKETDFLLEAENSEKCLKNFQESSLRDSVYVPNVYWDLSSKVVMTQEWIDGISFGDIEACKKKYRLSDVMSIVVSLFSDQIFRTGFVHCDPHQGNLIVRDNIKTGKPELVLLDHALYIQCSEKFRKEYCRFWVSMFSNDIPLLEEIGKEWGIPDTSILASATLARPWKQGDYVHVGQKTRLRNVYESHVSGKDKLVEFLKNYDKIPQELNFISRNINIVRANNKSLGSPVNRLNIMAMAAARSADYNPSGSLSETLKSNYNYFIFRSILMLATITFYFTRVSQTIRSWFGYHDSGIEGLLDEQLKKRIEADFPGFVLDDSVFEC